MKRILLAVLICLFAGALVFAQTTTTQTPTTQTSNIPTAAQTLQTAQDLLNQSNTNASQYTSTLTDLRTLNVNNSDAATLTRLTNEIASLENNINSEETAIRNNLEKGTRLNAEVINSLEELITQHQEKIQELQTFMQSIQTTAQSSN